MRTVALVAGIGILVANAAGVVRVLIVPRPAGSAATVSMRVVRAAFGQLARLPRRYEAKDRLLALSEPVALVALLATWLVIATGAELRLSRSSWKLRWRSPAWHPPEW